MGRRVLVIDDDELSLQVLELLLEDAGDVVTTAGSGEEALRGLEGGGERPELVLMDWQMPGVSGAALAGRLRALCGAETQVVAMSGSRPETLPEGVFDAFLLKPFSVEELVGALPGLSVRTAAENEVVVLDERVFESFRSLLDAEALRELYGTCVRDAGAKWREMVTAQVAGDDGAFRSAAHAMKGSLGMVGARELQGMCGVLEGGIGNTTLVTLEHFSVAIWRLRRMLIALGVEIAPEAEETPGG